MLLSTMPIASTFQIPTAAVGVIVNGNGHDPNAGNEVEGNGQIGEKDQLLIETEPAKSEVAAGAETGVAGEEAEGGEVDGGDGGHGELHGNGAGHPANRDGMIICLDSQEFLPRTC